MKPTEKYQGSQVSNAPTPAPLPVAQSPIPPGFSNSAEWEGFKGNVLRAHTQGLIPQSIKTPEMALVIALKGRELGLEPLYALSKIHVINGKPGLEAELMLALIKRKYPDADFRYPTKLDDLHRECTIETRRGDKEWQAFRFTIEDALRAGLVLKDKAGTLCSAPGKAVWIQYPQDMLRARAISRMARAAYPECIMGVRTPEELQNSIETASVTTVRDVDARFSKANEEATKTALIEGTGFIDTATMTAIPNEKVFKEPEVLVVEQSPEIPLRTELHRIGNLRHDAIALGVSAPFPVECPPIKVEKVAVADLPGDYTVKFGRYTGKQLFEIPNAELRDYAIILKASNGEVPKELINAIEAYLKAGI